MLVNGRRMSCMMELFIRYDDGGGQNHTRNANQQKQFAVRYIFGY